jgi:ATP-dependent HslUV protease ATP-binding subunit HslU
MEVLTGGAAARGPYIRGLMTEPAHTTDVADPYESLTPRQIVAELDKHIVGHSDAQRAVPIVLRNLRRRLRV